MKSFKQYISESVNTHLEHLEDEILNNGIDGTRQTINFLRGLRDLLSGNSKSQINVSVKWDGAPAIVTGIDPSNGRFFVGTKSVFNKNPKINYTNSDIDINHPSKDLNKKLKIALKEFPKLGIKGVIQGDLLFTKEDLKIRTIFNEKMLTFKPNTILYSVPLNSKLASEILNSKIGIVFHTTYTGNSLDSMSANFNFNINTLTLTPSVWVKDAIFKDVSGVATMTRKQTQKLNLILSQIGQLFRLLDSRFINFISNEQKIRMLIKTFNNSQIRKGKDISNPSLHAKKLINFIEFKFKSEISSLKTDKAKKRRQIESENIKNLILNNEKQFVIMFTLQKKMNEAKLLLIRQLEKVNSLGTFIETPNGLKVTSPEGFVAVDRNGSAIKLVDRLEFSRANFNLNKNWSK